MNTESFPETLVEAVRYFANPDNAFNFLVDLRWPNGVKCPRCQSEKVMPIATRKTWECKCCTEKKQFSVRVGTIFEDSPLSLDKWLVTIWLISNAKNGVSSYEIHRAIGVTQKTAWFMLQRIRLAMQTGTFDKLKGEVEVDETYIGGRGRFMHKSRKEKMGMKTGSGAKETVLGFLERGGEVRVMHVAGCSRQDLTGPVLANVEPASAVYTDALRSYARLGETYAHQFIDHAESYVEGQVHTNGLENFWSLLKRTLKGTYTHVDPEHLFRYLDEQVFRFNNRKMDDSGRFLKAAFQIIGKRLTYAELTGKA